MLDACRLDESDKEDKKENEVDGAPSTLTVAPDASPKEIVTDVTDDKLEDVCQNLEFLLHNDDTKVKALYAKFKKGFKEKFDDLKCKVGYVSIKNLHPTQNVIFLEKSLKPILNGSWVDKDHGGQPVVKSLLDEKASKEMKLGYLVVCNVGGTNYLIDGHHRWSKAYMTNPNAKLYAYVLPSDGIFKNGDDVLKFAQCEIALYLGRNNNKNHPVNKDANKADDINIYKASAEVIKEKAQEYLTDDVVKIFADKDNVLNGKYDTREKIAGYIAGNKDVMVKNAPAGVHDRTYMPQYPDSNGPGEALKNVNEGKTKMKKKYTKKQITEAIAYWKNQLKKMNEAEEKMVDPAITFLRGAVEKFKDEKLDPKDWQKLDDRLWEEMQNFVKEYGSAYGLKLATFSVEVDKAWMRAYDANKNDPMFLALGDSTRQMIIKANK